MMFKRHKRQNNMRYLLVGLMFLLAMLAALQFIRTNPIHAAAADVPAGCPGSSLAGPPAPGVCESIPAGCPGSTQAAPKTPPADCPHNFSSIKTGDKPGTYQCGDGDSKTFTSIDLGCRAKGNGILDALFAIIRFLSIGVGIVVVGSIVVAGIQYTTSRGDPSATAKALERVRNTLIALAIFIFMYAILNFLIPGAILK